MAQLYVPDKVYLICTDGMTTRQLRVTSQSTIKIAKGRLAATVNDKTGENFNCAKMVLAMAIVGALVALVVCAAIVLSGGTLGVTLGVAMAGAAAAGGAAGFLAGLIPCICAMLTQGWYPYHTLVQFEKQYPILETSKIPCLLGGEVQIIYSKELAEAYQEYKRSETALNFAGIVLCSFLGGTAISSLAGAGSTIFKVGVEYGIKSAAVQASGTLSAMAVSWMSGFGYSKFKQTIPVGGSYTLDDVVTGRIYDTDSDLIQGETLADQLGNKGTTLTTHQAIGALGTDESGAITSSQAGTYYDVNLQVGNIESQSVIIVDPQGNASLGSQTTGSFGQVNVNNQGANSSVGITGSSYTQQNTIVNRNRASSVKLTVSSGTQYQNNWSNAMKAGVKAGVKGIKGSLLTSILTDVGRAVSNFALSKKIDKLTEAEGIEETVKEGIKVYETKV